MNYKAKDLLPEWFFQSMKFEGAEDALGKYQEAIDKVLKIEIKKEKAFWFDILRVYFGILDGTHSSHRKLVEFFRASKSDFPITQNAHLVQTLSASLLAQKIDKNDEWGCDELALAIMNFRFGNTEDHTLVADLVARASKHYVDECESNRKISDIKELKVQVPDTKLEVEVEEYTITNNNYGGAVTSSVTSALNNIKVGLEGLATDFSEIGANFAKNIEELVKGLNSQITSMNKNQGILQEELNVLWWLNGGFSELFDKQLKQLEVSDLPISVGLELSSLTKFGPGLGRVDNLISKAISDHPLNNEEVTFESFIEQCSRLDLLQDNFSKVETYLEDFCPIVYALKCKAEYPDDGGWKVIFKKRHSTKLQLKLDAFKLSKQFYRELRLLTVA